MTYTSTSCGTCRIHHRGLPLSRDMVEEDVADVWWKPPWKIVIEVYFWFVVGFYRGCHWNNNRPVGGAQDYAYVIEGLPYWQVWETGSANSMAAMHWSLEHQDIAYGTRMGEPKSSPTSGSPTSGSPTSGNSPWRDFLTACRNYSESQYSHSSLPLSFSQFMLSYSLQIWQIYWLVPQTVMSRWCWVLSSALSLFF